MEDPYKLVVLLATPLSRHIPDSLKFHKKNMLYGFLNGAIQTTIETAFFGQVINYSFTRPSKNFSLNPKVIYKTFPKNLNGLLPYYTTTRFLQNSMPDIPYRNWAVRLSTPLLVLPHEHFLNFFTSKMFTQIQRPICSVYQNVIPFTAMELILESASVLRPTYQKAFSVVVPSGWAKLGAAALNNSVGYFCNHPFWVVNGFLKSHPEMSVYQAVNFLYNSGGINAFYKGAVHRCTRAAHSAMVTSLAAVAFETLFLYKEKPKKLTGWEKVKQFLKV
ncbi:hypothetical protein EIN_095110 [Entamoeba invadens IP1]|uniref:Mitochondrial carrier protein n=1 Tax=Entamoeba invadens IP1 TaxID=370355 RepID=A0A0A1U068_ENTIV|nr:hypothetical protein EIN_095110 [Entamoeba invadens IP1]ELP87274.1 hypothetical protein EIN_095110 [Entamoeba invadens IP1]|eukprot:XP_004254045.1 hypothetical protein EIN_095110 [Entamoeba invadens IP1]